MRNQLFGILAVGCLSTSLLAQPTPPNRNGPGDAANPPERRDDGPPRQPRNPRPQGEGDEGGPRQPRVVPNSPMKMEKGAYLGVSTTPAPQVLRQQFGLPRGVGLVVDAVAPKSPAEEAGIKPMDVLHKVNEQILINQQQLAVLVRTFKPGDTLKLTVFRDGKSTELSAKLDERELRPLDEMRLGMDPFGGAFPLDRRPDGMPNFIEPRGFQDRPNRIDPDRPFPPGLMKEEFHVAWDDGKVQMNLTVKDGKRHLIAKDHDGKELYNGPVDTEDDQKKLPPEVRERLQHVGLPGMRIGPNRPGERQNPDLNRERPNPDRENPPTRPSRGVILEIGPI
jgi:hypothetical protein